MTKAGGLVIAVTLAAFAAAPSAGQAPADPIDALLKRAPAQRTVDPEEPDTAAEGTTRVSPDAAGSERGDAAYDNRLRASAAAAAGFHGPMEGGWSLTGGGRELYVFELIDRDGAVEGAWRDPRRPAALDSSGFIDVVERSGADVTFRFAASAVAVLHAGGDGRWTGELEEAGKTERVTLVRRGP
jgi:hypothetical protein